MIEFYGLLKRPVGSDREWGAVRQGSFGRATTVLTSIEAATAFIEEKRSDPYWDRWELRAVPLSSSEFENAFIGPTTPRDPKVHKTLDDFASVVEPVMKWLAENHTPHHKIIIEDNHAELVGGEMAHVTDKFIQD